MLNFLKPEINLKMATDVADPKKPYLPIYEAPFLNMNWHSRIISHVKKVSNMKDGNKQEKKQVNKNHEKKKASKRKKKV